MDSSHELLQLAGRDPARTAEVARLLNLPFTSPINSVRKDADIYVVAIGDDALYSIGDWFQLERKLVVHTAGSVPKDVLRTVSKNYGVLYPLQSLKADLNLLPEIPFLVDGNTPDDLALIRDFASSLSGKVEMADDEMRLKLHVAAVVVNNFCNHLYTLTEKYCEQEHLPFELLHPLISETANRLTYLSAGKAQTGPALRRDQSTVARQLVVLKASG